MSRLFRDTMSNDMEGAQSFESNVAERDALDDFDGPDDDEDEPSAMTVGNLIDALSDFDPDARVSIAYAHNGEIGYSDIMSVGKQGESAQLIELEFYKDSDE